MILVWRGHDEIEWIAKSDTVVCDVVMLVRANVSICSMNSWNVKAGCNRFERQWLD